jgi:hypothetical protein
LPSANFVLQQGPIYFMRNQALPFAPELAGPWESYHVQLHNTAHYLQRVSWHREHRLVATLLGPNPEREKFRKELFTRFHTLFNRNPAQTTYGTWSLDLFKQLHSKHPQRQYTFVITSDGWWFTPTLDLDQIQDTPLNVQIDAMSKHVVLSKGESSVYFAGEFHLKLLGGQVQLLMNDCSGSYYSWKNRSDELYRLMASNFSGVQVVVSKFDPRSLFQNAGKPTH